MTTFLFITDTHLGASPMGYQQQRGYPERLNELLGCLGRWIDRAGPVDFVLHGGDIADRCHPDLIREAASSFRFQVPHYLCLGNHDLTQHDAVAQWLQGAPGFFLGPSAHFEIVCPDCVVHVVPNHWDESDYRWTEAQEPRLSPDQMQRLCAAIEADPGKLHVLCTHSPLFGVSPAQTGFADPYHDPGPAFRQAILPLLERYGRLACVLTGHNHINSLVRVRQALVISGSAFVEAPFEFKWIRLDAHSLETRTHSLASEIPFRTAYDFDRTFVQGRGCDRYARIDLTPDVAPASEVC